MEGTQPALVAAREAATVAALKAGRRRRRRRLDLVLGGGAAVAALLAVVAPSGWTALAVVLLSIAFIGRRALPQLLRLFVFAAIPYQLIWMSFIFARGLADHAPWFETTGLWVRRFEAWVFFGELPSSRLQRLLFDPNHLRPWDYFFTSLHISFFASPFIAAMALSWVDPARGRRFLVALALLLASGIPFFYLLPGNPPWMDPAVNDPNPVAVHRINALVAADWGVEAFEPDGTLTQESNSVAIVPSMHMGVSFLLFLSAPLRRRRWRLITGAYATLMAFSLVYLGEHQIVDEVVGIGLALTAWRLSPWIMAALTPVVAPIGATVQSRLGGLVTSRRSRAEIAMPEGGSA